MNEEFEFVLTKIVRVEQSLVPERVVDRDQNSDYAFIQITNKVFCAIPKSKIYDWDELPTPVREDLSRHSEEYKEND